MQEAAEQLPIAIVMARGQRILSLSGAKPAEVDIRRFDEDSTRRVERL